MKKIISIVLAVMLVVSLAAVSVNAYNSSGDYTNMLTDPNSYSPSDSYTVDANTPYAEDAIVACGGDLDEAQTIYFQAPEDWPNQFNTFAGPDDSEPYMHVCVYWWGGTGKEWPNGNGVKWVGYQAHLVDKENRIYSAQLPGDGNTPVEVWNNGVNAGMDETAEIFKYGRQLMDANIEGAEEGDYATIPEGSPNPDTMDGCIQIIDYTVSQPNPLTGFDSYGSNWYIYYGKGCYGNYAKDSDNFTSVQLLDLNPDHHHCDVNFSGTVEATDATALQRHLAQIDILDADHLKLGDPDADGAVSIMDATRIQRYLAEICNIDGSKPYSAAANAYLDLAI